MTSSSSGSLYSLLVTALLMVCCASASEVRAQEVSSEEGWVPEILKEQSSGVREGQSLASSSTPYLPDYSYAGYRWGEEPLPDPQGKEIDVVEFGAVPNDGKDDTSAIREALRAAHKVDGPVILSFPSGRFIIRQILFIERSSFVLQGTGDGEEGTELHFPRPLREMSVPEGYEEPLSAGQSPFSWRGGVIWTRQVGESESQKLARAVAGRRGHHTVKTSVPTGLQDGDVVQIKWFNREGRRSSLLNHIYCTTQVSFGTNLYKGSKPLVASQEVTIENVRGNTLEIKEPLLHDLQKRWEPIISTTDFLEEVGIQSIRITFPKEEEYGGHLQEDGYNGIYLKDLLHSWVRDVTIENADSGILSGTSKNFTIKNIEAGGGRWGHYSVHIGNVYGALVTDFNIFPTIHNPSFNTRSRGSVYSDGFIRSPALDQHMGINHQNLFDNLRARYNDSDVRLFNAGGSDSRWGPVAGAFNTFWNVQVKVREVSGSAVESTKGVLTRGGAPYGRLVGVRGTTVPINFEYGPNAYIEGKNRSGIAVKSLYDYQLEKRLAGEMTPSLVIYNPLDGYGFEKGEPVTISAEVRGDFDPERVRFFADGDEIGVDNDEGNRWSIMWSSPPNGSHSITAIAENSSGDTIETRPLSCSGEPVRIWVGDESNLLRGNFPNPFHESTTIKYALPATQHVRLDVYDLLGRRVRTLVNQLQFSGLHRERFDASNLASGTYYYRIKTSSSTDIGKAVHVR